MGVGLNDNNAILNSVDVVVKVGVELGKNSVLPFFWFNVCRNKCSIRAYHLIGGNKYFLGQPLCLC